MITVDQLLGFGVAALILIAIPGPSVVFVIGRALAYGRGVALASVAGNSLGLLTIVVLVAFGLGVVVQESIVVFNVLKLVGAAYLVYLGVEAFRRRKEFLAQSPGLGGGMTWRRAIRQGYVVGVTNPKAYMIRPRYSPSSSTAGPATSRCSCCSSGCSRSASGWCPTRPGHSSPRQLRSWFVRKPRRGEAMGAVGGVSMIGLGVGLAFTGDPR